MFKLIYQAADDIWRYMWEKEHKKELTRPRPRSATV